MLKNKVIAKTENIELEGIELVRDDVCELAKRVLDYATEHKMPYCKVEEAMKHIKETYASYAVIERA